jgi:restriction system protein
VLCAMGRRAARAEGVRGQAPGRGPRPRLPWGGGIDGVLHADRLGLDVLYSQATRWETTVGRPAIQRFAGALQGRRACQGMCITTSGFSQEAEDYAARSDARMICMDGARLLVDHHVGVSTVSVDEVKKSDAAFFTEG